MKETMGTDTCSKIFRFIRGAAGFCLLCGFVWGISGCQIFAPKVMDGSALERIDIDDYPDFGDDLAYENLADSIRMSLAYLEKLPKDRLFYFGEESYDCAHMIHSLEYFLRFLKTEPTEEEMRVFIASKYRVYQSVAHEEENGMLVTGYYEPLLKGSLTAREEFPWPIYSLPDDLAFIDLSRFDLSLPVNKKLVGRVTDDHQVVPYYQRQEIVQNRLNGKSVPLAWVADRVDRFFLEIQGSGKIFIDGDTYINVHYHASNGHPYKSIGALLIKEEKIPREEMSMQRIKEYLRNHPQEVDGILNYNPSFVFFRVEEDGPIGCLGVPVTPGRSVALQRRIFPAAALGYLESAKPVVNDAMEIQDWAGFQRFIMNQDTGGAIKGPGRVDLFWGNGPYAEVAAGYMQHPGRLFFMVLKPEQPEP